MLPAVLRPPLAVRFATNRWWCRSAGREAHAGAVWCRTTSTISPLSAGVASVPINLLQQPLQQQQLQQRQQLLQQMQVTMLFQLPVLPHTSAHFLKDPERVSLTGVRLDGGRRYVASQIANANQAQQGKMCKRHMSKKGGRSDPEKPKRPLHPWLRFLADYRKANPESKGKNAMIIGAAEWKKLSEQQRRPYTEPYEKELEGYKILYDAYVSSGKKEAWRRDPEKPKRPQTGFFRFLHEFRTRVPALKVTEQTTAAAEAWKGMSEKDKKPYMDKYIHEKAQYDAKMKEYKASGKEAAWKEKKGKSESEKRKEAAKEKAAAKKKKDAEKKKLMAEKKKAAKEKKHVKAAERAKKKIEKDEEKRKKTAAREQAKQQKLEEKKRKKEAAAAEKEASNAGSSQQKVQQAQAATQSSPAKAPPPPGPPPKDAA